MDKDIRDFSLDDDLFDPFEDEEEDEDGGLGEPEAASDDGELVGAPLQHAEPVKVELSPQERIEKLFKEMPGQRRMFLKVIDYCRTERSCQEMDDFINEQKEYFNSIYSPVVIRELLEEAGAIRYLSADGAEDDTEFVPVAETGREMTPDIASARDASGEEGMLVPVVDASKVVVEEYVEDGEEIEMEFLEIEQPDEGMWVATEEGLETVDSMDDVKGSQELIAKEPVYVDIYHEILDYVSTGYGRSAKEIDRLVNDSPLLEEPRRYSGYFVARLEREGAIEWKDGWVITDAGRTVLEGMTSHD